MEIMDDKAKRNIAVLSWAPAIAFLIFAIYYLYILVTGMEANINATTTTAQHYDTLFVILATSAVIGAITLIYLIIHLARTKLIPTGTKIIWLIFLTAFVPISCLVFYYTVIRKEPKYLDTYPDIA